MVTAQSHGYALHQRRPACALAGLCLAGVLPAFAQAEGRASIDIETDGTSQLSSVTPSASSEVDEIVVTATRRSMNVQDLPASIQVLSGELLERTGVQGMQDYVFSIPGADVVDTGADRRLSLRGISNTTARGNGAGASTSPIGLYLNDTPIQGNGVLPDLDLYDLSRIEVLKGPQGTLFGEGAQGGAIRMILAPADPFRKAVKAEFGMGRTGHGSGLNNQQKLAVNLPLGNQDWALRLVGSRTASQGFIDYFNVAETDANSSQATMARVHLDGQWREGFQSSLMLLHQARHVNQFPAYQLEEGDLKNRHTEPQFIEARLTLADVTLDYDMGFATLTSSTSGYVNDRDLLSRHQFVGPTVFVLLNPATGGADLEQGGGTVAREWLETANSQFGVASELRLLSSAGDRLDWTAGVFFRQRQNDFDFFINNSDTANVPPPSGPGVVRYLGVEDFKQFAVFGEVTLPLHKKLDLGLGLRLFREDVSLDGLALTRGPFYPLAVAAANPEGEFPAAFSISTNALTPKLWLSWALAEDRMLYLQLSNGVRSGGTNHNALPADVTPLFEPDSLWTLEAGAKSQWFAGRLTANVTAFYNAWDDMQVQSAESGQVRGSTISISVGVVKNVSRAYTRGVELELLGRPLADLAIGMNLFAGDGEIVEGDVDGDIPDHSPVPQLAAFSYAAFVQYSVSHWHRLGLRPAFRVDVQSTGDREAFVPILNGEWPLQGFTLLNAHLTLARGDWELGLTLKNLTDERAQLGVLPFDSDTFSVGTPRSWTLRAAFEF